MVRRNWGSRLGKGRGWGYGLHAVVGVEVCAVGTVGEAVRGS